MTWRYKCPRCGYWGVRSEFEKKRDIVERFLSHIEIPEDPEACWPWKGYHINSGYGYFYPVNKDGLGTLGQGTSAHRFAYTVFKGEIPGKWIVVHHSCKNRGCVNPDHLFLATHSENQSFRNR